MKFIILFCAVVSVAVAISIETVNDADTIDGPSLISYQNNNDGLGPYSFAFETSDGIKRKEEALVVNTNDPENQSLVVKGSYSYVAPDGVTYTVNYVADENGYRVE